MITALITRKLYTYTTTVAYREVSKMRYIKRFSFERILYQLKRYPVVALLGPRQVGKSTLAKAVLRKIKKAVYFDLQSPSDLQRMEDPVALFERHKNQLVIIDEIQKAPELFSILRSLIDKKRRNGRILVLGSASRDLIKQSSETLAGRICYMEIMGFQREEIKSIYNFNTHWTRGGLPLSLLAGSDEDSFDWRKNYIQTFLERDIPLLGFGSLPPTQMRRLWKMLAHYHGQILNISTLSQSLGLSTPSLKKHISQLEQTFIIRTLEPYHHNLKRRLIKSPKVYIRDSGLLHALLDIENIEALMGHPVCGTSFEGFVMENLLSHFPLWTPSFLKTSNGAEVDLVLSKGQKTIFFEMKLNSAPKVSKGFHLLVEAIKPDKTFVIAPVTSSFKIKKLTYTCLDEFLSLKI